ALAVVCVDPFHAQEQRAVGAVVVLPCLVTLAVVGVDVLVVQRAVGGIRVPLCLVALAVVGVNVLRFQRAVSVVEAPLCHVALAVVGDDGLIIQRAVGGVVVPLYHVAPAVVGVDALRLQRAVGSEVDGLCHVAVGVVVVGVGRFRFQRAIVVVEVPLRPVAVAVVKSHHAEPSGAVYPLAELADQINFFDKAALNLTLEVIGFNVSLFGLLRVPCNRYKKSECGNDRCAFHVMARVYHDRQTSCMAGSWVNL